MKTSGLALVLLIVLSLLAAVGALLVRGATVALCSVVMAVRPARGSRRAVR